jgi:hypothetical protein
LFDAGGERGINRLDEFVSRGVQDVDVSLRGRDLAVIRSVSACGVFSAPLLDIVLVELEQPSQNVLTRGSRGNG